MTLEEHIKDTVGKSYTERVLLWFQKYWETCKIRRFSIHYWEKWETNKS